MTGTRRMHSPLINSQGGITSSQVKPCSVMQVLEQPSPSIWLPSSQSSPITRPSPHAELHPVVEPGMHVGSFSQVSEQPSNGTTLPSSQLSAPSWMASPQVAGVHTLGAPSHFMPFSILQRSEQP